MSASSDAGREVEGLDARAVILIGSPRWDDLQSDMRQPYWIAASRARQMLAVVSC